MIAILADIHANLPALEAVLADMPKGSEIWVLGDIIGELPYPCEVLDRLADLPQPVASVAGNREVSLLEAKRGEHPQWWQGSQMRTLAWTTDQLQPRHWEYMQGILPCLPLDCIPQGALLFHGMPKHVRGSITTQVQAEEAIQGVSQRWLACGHTHKARLFHAGYQTVINAGSVGMSLDGIGGVACYALLDETCEQGSGHGVVFRHVAYDVEKMVRKLQSSELAEKAPGISRADILELRTGRHHVLSLLEFCHTYAERVLGHTVKSVPADLWREAERLWDGSEWMKGRTL